ncbi:hypothetical protein H6F44_12355 [Pseudanabaena sp. FACHB-1277]|uniref:Catalase n=1 Tax=Pseudanabaena cinerea FACHB-1277 TaxID=2949581 RepID=A0A926Z6Q3_9CYAN|nr:hypothetical protein [Pseudanabaena cinerea]MBD2150905.1 hypothetical protein [Pseudanabaena cinerea FACHB-1277]
MLKSIFTGLATLFFLFSSTLSSFAAPLADVAQTPSSATTATCELEIGKEYIPSSEAEDIAKITAAFKQGSTRETASRKEKGLAPIALRRTHPKTQAIVTAKFTVSKDIPEQFQYGIFANPKKYNAVVRLSNAAPTEGGEFRSDAIADTHGISIKLKGLEGGMSQDFLLNDHPNFIAASPNELINFILGGAAVKQGQQINQLPVEQQKALIRGITLTKASDSLTKNPLDQAYFSQTPYKLGNGAVKYILKPREVNTPAPINAKDPNYALQEALVETLSTKDVYFDLFIQPQTNACTELIEDSSVEWKSALIPVATLKIPSQVIDFDKQNKRNEKLVFSPWNALPENQPLGGLNRARKAVYPPLTELRQELNKAAKKEV